MHKPDRTNGLCCCSRKTGYLDQHPVYTVLPCLQNYYCPKLVVL